MGCNDCQNVKSEGAAEVTEESGDFPVNEFIARQMFNCHTWLFTKLCAQLQSGGSESIF